MWHAVRVLGEEEVLEQRLGLGSKLGVGLRLNVRATVTHPVTLPLT